MNVFRVCMVAVVCWVASLSCVHAQETNYPSTDTPERVYWEKRIKKVGGLAAHTELVGSLKGVGAERAHDEAHFFGAAAYNVLGIEGIGVCDDRFMYGCFHEFLIHATVAHGTQSVSRLDTACIDALGPYAPYCRHGIGHGLVLRLGYSDAGLREALKACAPIDIPGSTGGCRGGVFMEYNLRGTTEGYEDPRPLVDPRSPCHELHADDALVCAFWQPQWLLRVIGGTTPEDRVRRIGSVCFSFQGRLRTACFAGAGNVIGGSTGYIPGESSLCTSLTTEKKNQRVCVVAAVRRFSTRVSKGDGACTVPRELTGNRTPPSL